MSIFNFGTAYYLSPLSRPNLYMNRHGEGVIINNQNVDLYAPSGSVDQQWVFINAGAGNMRIANQRNRGYGLNIWRGANNMNNCDVCTFTNNGNDTLIKYYELTPTGMVGTSTVFLKFQLVNYPTLYLTVVGNDLRWAADKGTYSSDQLFAISTTQGGGGTTSGILSKDTVPPTATALTPYIINGIPDKQQSDGIDDGVEYHPGCGFANGLNFNDSSDGTAVKSALQSYVKKAFKIGYDMDPKNLCYYMYGERIANGTGQQFHPGVDISLNEGAIVYAVLGGNVVYANADNYGTVGIAIPTHNNVVTNYVHMKNLKVSVGQTIAAGTPIGEQSGKGGPDTGITTFSSHLHFEVRTANSLGPASSVYSPTNPLTTIKPYGYMQG